ncbi:adenylate kinase [Ancylostoma caninum]|uniref:Adenylate kinase isoenzyme 1 n=1 Tax=Ancylostoma caninum TaxID=29170 RepID=A0A368H4E3_ANCCA|nr:adenylate kinase [Ancylostoma caninum]
MPRRTLAFLHLLSLSGTVGRIEDKEEPIKKRLKTHNIETPAVAKYYEKHNKLVKIDAKGAAEEVFAAAVKQLDDVMTKLPQPRKVLNMAPLKKAKLPILFIVGGPGSGKGTQCERIVAKYGFSHLSSGDLLREEVKSGSPRGAQLSKIMEAGELVPQEIVLDLLKEAMLKEVAKGSKGFLIDGYPREVKQGELFEKEIQQAKSVIFFDVSDDILVERLLNRAKTRQSQVSHYEKQKKLARIKAHGTIDEIFAELVQHIDSIVKKKARATTYARAMIDLAPLKRANVPIFFIIGGPGSGKGTQCEKIAEKYSLSHLSSGDLLREEVKSRSPRGGFISKFMEAGDIVPFEIVLDLIKEVMLKKVARGSKGFLIDGYPMDVEEGEQFEKEVQEVKSVIFFDASDEVLTERLLQHAKTSGRADDNKDTIEKRLKTFSITKTPIIEHYEKKKKLVRIKADGNVEEIFAEVVKHLDGCIGNKSSNRTAKFIPLFPSLFIFRLRKTVRYRGTSVDQTKGIDLTPLKKAAVPIFFIVGRPGSGKGTQCEKIVEKYGLSHLSSGHLLRDDAKSGSPRGAIVAKIMKAGELVQTDIVLDLLKEAMLKEVAKGSKGFVIDGYPLEVRQGERFENEIQQPQSVIFFDASDDILLKRLLKRAKTSGRVDDNLETIRVRLQNSTTATALVVDYYKKKNKLVRIQAEGTVDEIFAAVEKHLDSQMKKKPEGLTVERKAIDLAPLKNAGVPIFFIVGGPGSGKGTQCEKIVAKYGLSHLSSGDLLREEVKSGSPRGAQLTKIMEAGELVPLEVVLDLIKEAMLKEVAKGSKGFLIDGYPREVKQGEEFEKEIQEAKSVIFFDAPDEILVERLMHRAKTSGRADDNMETIKKRLKTFTTATAPVVDHYEKKNKLVRIKAQGTVEEIFAEVVKHLDTQMEKKAIERKVIDLEPLKKANVPIFFIVGGPGSGKGTQCEKIVAKYSLSHLSSGDLLRDEVKSGSPRGAQLTKIMEAGELVPLEFVLDLIKEAIINAVVKGTKGFLIDGYPREVKQGEQFEKEIQEAKSVIFLDASDEILIERLLKRAKTSGRVDDNLETIKKRLNTFHAATAPVVEYYEKKKKLIKIMAKGTVEEIFAKVVEHLDVLMATK